ncbi:hypothetical protein Tco_0280779 [Tanacetum coccineum]
MDYQYIKYRQTDSTCLDQQIRRIHQLDTTYRPFHSEHRIDSTVMHDKEFTKELITPFENPESEFRSKRRLYETPGYEIRVLPNGYEKIRSRGLADKCETNDELADVLTVAKERKTSKLKSTLKPSATRRQPVDLALKKIDDMVYSEKRRVLNSYEHSEASSRTYTFLLKNSIGEIIH